MLQISSDASTQRRTARNSYNAIGLAQNDLVRQYGEMVRRIAWHVYSRMSSSIELEDLIQTGLMALIEAANGYEDRGFAFATYASTRVRGAMIDQLRKEARMTRSALAGRRKVTATRARLEQEYMRPPTAVEMAEGMEMDLAAYNALLVSAVPVEAGSIDEHYSDHDPWFADPEEGADSTLEQSEMRELLARYIGELSERETMILQLFFVEELNLEEIGQTLGVGAARVCQIKKAALSKLRKRMEDVG
jgi:RNA polymerase sigma factor FliA